MPVTLHDIATYVGVTEATVSNAINNRGKMNANTRQRILEAAAEMGYAPNSNARRLAHNRTKTIGILVPNLENPFYGSLIRQLVKYCEKKHYSAVIADSFESSSEEYQVVSRMVSERVEGLLIVPTNYGYPSTSYLPLLVNNNIPYLYITSRVPDSSHPFVMTDLMDGTYQLVNHLFNRGHNQIAFLTGNEDNPISHDRNMGYRKAYQEAGIEVNENLLIPCNSFDYKGGYSHAISLLQQGIQIDAIITINDFMAAGVLMALTENQIEIPKQIAVAGYDDLFFSQIARVPLTTVHQNIDQLSQKSINLLFSMIKDPHHRLTTQIYLKPELLVRSST